MYTHEERLWVLVVSRVEEAADDQELALLAIKSETSLAAGQGVSSGLVVGSDFLGDHARLASFASDELFGALRASQPQDFSISSFLKLLRIGSHRAGLEPRRP